MKGKDKKRISPTMMPLAFEVDPEPIEQKLTANAGLPLVAETYRKLMIPQSVERNVRIKRRERGFDEATMVESFILLNASGGDCLDDFNQLRKDEGLVELIGHQFPSPAVARKFLYQFHDDQKIEEAKAQIDSDKIAYIPDETEALIGLGQVNRELVQIISRGVDKIDKATIDLDATIIDSRKKDAKYTYEGGKGYQPMVALREETNLVVADQFRDGNVPAIMDPLSITKDAFASLPGTINEYFFRGDSACHEGDLLQWLSNNDRVDGPKGPIGFAISARMTTELHKACKIVKDWKPYGSPDPEVIRECADVVFVSSHEAKNRDSQPFRYVGIRITKSQGELFADGNQTKYFAVISNRWDISSEDLLAWHRKKAGTIELVHDVIKNELAGGVMPCSRFGADAAWFRLAVVTHNILTAMKLLILPDELKNARPKRLRFLIFNTAGAIIHHARQIILRLAASEESIRAYWIKVLNAEWVGS